MLALAYSLFLFTYWTVLGRAVLAVVYPRFGVLRSWFVAPAVGLSVVLLGLMVFNQAGIPLGRFAVPLTVALGVLAIAVLGLKRPRTSPRHTLPFALAIVFAWLWTGWPAFESGFDWISYANDDMANYCLAAQRFIDLGFYQPPTMAQLAGRDYASYYFFMHVADMMRFGAEHIVAWSAVVAHVKATQGFMPVIVSLALVQVSAAGALALHTGRWRRRALLTMWVLAASPLFMLGTLYQLIAQVGGVALLLATLALLTRPFASVQRSRLMRYAILPGITAGALCIFYPEVTPFVGLTFATFAFVSSIRRREFPHGLIALAAYTLVGVLIVLRHNLISYVSILVVQFNGAMDASNLLLSLFPYFMLPTGFSNLLGWMPISWDFPEPVVSLSIAAGMLVVLLVLLRGIRDAWRATPAAILLLIQFTFAARLFTGANDFGLYKLAMWTQPVLAAGIAGWIAWATRKRPMIGMVVVAVYAATAAPTALFYSGAARGMRAGGLTELRLASRLGLHIEPPADKDAQLTSTIENVVAAKFAATELRDHPLALVSRDFFWPTTRTDFKDPIWPVRMHPHFPEMAEAAPLITVRNRDLVTMGLLWGTQFSQPVVDRPTDLYVSLQPELSLFNKFNLLDAARAEHSVFVVEPANALRNRLLFVHSGLGNHYYLGDRRKISFFQQEGDYFAKGHVFNGIGRFMLLRIENPTPKVYLRIAATRTLVTGHTAWSPNAVVHGNEDLPLGAVGNGSFNLFLGPLEPKEFQGGHYLAIDFAEMPRLLMDFRTGLKRLYNVKVPADYRRLIGWARDISAITEEEFNRLQRPREVANFPEDLSLAKTLEYAGMFEDGWISHHAKFSLAGSAEGELMRLRIGVPELRGTPLGTGTVRVTINGDPVSELSAPLGTSDWLLPIPRPDAITRVELQFSATGQFPGRDQRPAAARLEYLGLVKPGALLEADYRVPDGPRLAAPGVDHDGWMRREASLVLPASASPSIVTLQFEYPTWSDRPVGTLQAEVDGVSAPQSITLRPGEMPIAKLHLPASSSLRRIRFVAPPEFRLPAPDQRQRAVRLLSASVSPAP